jgi:hypothetical protein
MAKRVVVEVTKRQLLKPRCRIIPFTYENRAGLQKKDPTHYLAYWVPLYVVRVQGGSEYAALRFGLVNHGEKTPKKERQCDAGLTSERSVQSRWIGTYSPHSFTLPGRKGAWQIMQDFLIHQGTDGNSIGGALGCVEICGPQRWDMFLAEIERLAEVPCEEIGKQQLLTINIEAAVAPMAELADPVPIPPQP